MQILLGTLAYIIVTFPLAVLWHMKIFRDKYMHWQYFGEDVKPILGLASMIILVERLCTSCYGQKLKG